ncbi:adenine phosphoribosyltransferase [Candidatus Desantisbacteria bacterium]|nr:adenine phosphoribosyltransferase [Candidatus Desantisbacteria bacterium]
MDLKKYIRDIPDFPKKGIIFKDITTLLINGKALKYVINKMAEQYKNDKIDAVVGVESRGFIVGSALAYKMGVGFIPIRKPGKLPYKTIKATYALEYGTDSIEIHEDAIKPSQNILIVDDLLATGGTAGAVVELVSKLGGNIAGIAFIIELSFLNGKDKLPGQKIFSLIQY